MTSTTIDNTVASIPHDLLDLAMADEDGPVSNAVIAGATTDVSTRDHALLTLAESAEVDARLEFARYADRHERTKDLISRVAEDIAHDCTSFWDDLLLA
jgi:hypothetical protein